MKFSILMPTYNDEDSIEETLNSIKNQSYDSWELLIMDDGSSDNTKSVIQNFIRDSNLPISYYRQENGDQLSAIDNLIPYITGDIVFILHSDDTFASNNSLELYSQLIMDNPGYDSYYGDLLIMDESSKETGKVIKPMILSKQESTLISTFLWLGRNSYVDYSFFDVDFFKSKVKERYLSSNVPYWFDKNFNNISNSLYCSYPMAKYRIHSDNYINNEVGSATVLSGNLRVFNDLMSIYTIPLFKIQYNLFRVINKVGKGLTYKPFYLKKPSKNKMKLAEFVIEKRLGSNKNINLFYGSILGFLSNETKSKTVSFEGIIPKIIFKGRDASKFFKKLFDGSLEPEYYSLFELIENGFDTVKCTSGNLDEVYEILDFFCIGSFVKVEEIES